MAIRIVLVGAIAVLIALALVHPAGRPPISTVSAVPSETALPPRGWNGAQRRHVLHPPADDMVVYIAGAVKRPGLYRVRGSDRAEQAIERAGGFTAAADPAGVNLAAHVADGDEIYVPLTGELRHAGSPHHRRSRRARATPPPQGSVDVNRADATELATVPGIGRSIASRIVLLREQQGAYASLDELLDVAGMTQTRLERARPYLEVTGVAQPTP